MPFALAAYFVFQTPTQGTAFCAFFCFEQLLPVWTYMADARAQELPLLTVGDPIRNPRLDLSFRTLGVLDHDIQIGNAFRASAGSECSPSVSGIWRGINDGPLQPATKRGDNRWPI